MVTDGAPPTITCPEDETLSTALGLATARAEYASPSVADAVDAEPAVTCSVAPGAALPLGENGVECVATDDAGNSARCQFRLTVVDEEKPSITCPGTQKVETDPDSPTAVVDWPAAVTGDNSGDSVDVTFAPASGSAFSIGKSSVIATARDLSGNEASCMFTVEVADKQPPTLTSCGGDVVVNTTLGQATGEPEWGAVEADDNSGEAGTVVCSHQASTPFPIGKTTVSCRATDGSGNNASCSWTVEVTDAEPPQIQCPDDMAIENRADDGLSTGLATFSLPTATDNSGLAPVVRCDVESPAELEVGTHTITCTAEDNTGRKAMCSFAVTVVDVSGPQLSCPETATTTLAPGAAEASVEYESPTATDRLDNMLEVACSVKQGAMLPAGRHSVTCTATDDQGKEGTCVFVAVVEDKEPPVLFNCTSGLVEFATLAGERYGLPPGAACMPVTTRTRSRL
jgi:hypothetical protein